MIVLIVTMTLLMGITASSVFSASKNVDKMVEDIIKTENLLER